VTGNIWESRSPEWQVPSLCRFITMKGFEVVANHTIMVCQARRLYKIPSRGLTWSKTNELTQTNDLPTAIGLYGIRYPGCPDGNGIFLPFLLNLWPLLA